MEHSPPRRCKCARVLEWMHMDMAQIERTSAPVEVCFHWLVFWHHCNWPECIHTPVYTSTHTHTHSNPLFAFLALRWAVWRASSLTTEPKGQRWPQFGSTGFISLSSTEPCAFVCCQCDNMTSLIKFEPLELCFFYMYSILYIGFIFISDFPPLFCLPAAAFFLSR